MKLSQYNNKNIIIEYIIDKLLPFILTKKYNFHYGIPENYPLNSIHSESEKFKAIPYIAVDVPAYGSEFSDTILTIILTYFTYRKKGFFRKIDINLYRIYLFCLYNFMLNLFLILSKVASGTEWIDDEPCLFSTIRLITM